MPYTHTWETRGLLRRLYGIVTPDETLQAFSEMATDARFETILYIINDARDADLSGLPDERMKNFQSEQEVATLVNPNRIIAHVLPPNEVQRMQRFHNEYYARVVKAKFFTSIEEARQWVDEWVRLKGR